MNTLVHADIFFFISTIALVLISVVLITALIFVIKILRDLSEISRKVKEEGIQILNDVHELRGEIKHDGLRLGQFIKFFGMAFLKKRKAGKRAEKQTVE